MSAAKFTPGPWSAGAKRQNGGAHGEAPVYGLSIQRTGVMPVKVVVRLDFGYGKPEDDANARLIAAAPALYAALVKANATLTRFAESGFVLDPSECTEIDEALAKAVAP